MGTGLSVIQKGLESDLVLLFFPSAIGSLQSRLRKALGPAPTIVIDEGGTGGETLDQLFGFARARTGIETFRLACIGGYSAGCQRVRALRRASAGGKAFVFIDGTHASLPPQGSEIDYLWELAEEARDDQVTLVITHTYVVTEPKYASTAAVARLVTGWELPMPQRGSFEVHSDKRLTVYSVASEPIDIVAHSAQAQVWLPLILEGHIRPLIEPGYVPNRSASTSGAVPERILTKHDGWLQIEDQYLPRVVTAENGAAAPAALQAQAIAARTYLLRQMQDDPRLGTETRPVINSEYFQCYAQKATSPCIDATRSTAGIVATYRHEMIFANFVAGALWTAKGTPGADPTKTEKWITYNEGMTGTDVRGTPLVSTKRWQNRGCMSANGADWLARNGYDAISILRYFYGADMSLTDLRDAQPVPEPSSPPPSGPPSRPRAPTTEQASSGGDGAALLMIAGAGLTWMLRGSR